MFFKAKQMLKKARQSKHGSHPTILSRWYEQRLPKVIGGSQHWRKRKLCFSIASLLKDDTTATKVDRLQNAKHWILRLNADGPQKPLRQRPEFAAALKQCLRMQDDHLTETKQSLRLIRPEHQPRQQEDQQFEGGENFD